MNCLTISIIPNPTAMVLLGLVIGAAVGWAAAWFRIFWIGMTVDAHR